MPTDINDRIAPELFHCTKCGDFEVSWSEYLQMDGVPHWHCPRCNSRGWFPNRPYGHVREAWDSMLEGLD